MLVPDFLLLATFPRSLELENKIPLFCKLSISWMWSLDVVHSLLDPGFGLQPRRFSSFRSIRGHVTGPGREFALQEDEYVVYHPVQHHILFVGTWDVGTFQMTVLSVLQCCEPSNKNTHDCFTLPTLCDSTMQVLFKCSYNVDVHAWVVCST
jgi:hypothetical protein